MRRPVAFDLSRMIVGAAGHTPRGIDRVDMGYAKALLDDPARHAVGLLPSPRGMGVLRGEEARSFAAIVEGNWREDCPAADDPRHRWLMRRLAGEAEAPVSRPKRGAAARLDLAARSLRLAMRARGSVLRGAAAAVPRDALYVNTGQVLLGWPWFFRWLDARPDVKVVMMMHDLIPVLHPEYSGPVLSRHHARAVRTVARRATAMIATSHASADELREALGRLGRADLPFHVVPLPVDDSLLDAREPVRWRGRPYAVAVGIVDQRKNHRLLLHVWRDMVRAGLPDIPALVIAGSRGLRTSEIADFIERSPGLSDHVVEVNGLSTPALREVMQGARAVLMPSFTEGFGLPVVEALALGTPVIASDIPAHREVGGTRATYRDPLDGPGWREAILALTRAGEAAEARSRAALAGARPQTWASYVEAVMPILDSL